MASQKGGGGGISIYAPSLGDSGPFDGVTRYNSSLSRLEYYQASSGDWLPVPGGGGSGTPSILPATLPIILA